MARQIEKLTALKIRQTSKPGWHPDGANLYLYISKTGGKSFAFRYTFQGKANFLGLGSINTVSLAEAREIAKGMRKQLLDGVDPAKAKREAKLAVSSVPTFSEAAERFIAAKRTEWTNQKHADTWESSLRMHMEPTIGAIRVDHIQTGDIVKALEKIWLTMPETAGRTRQRVEKVFDWCKSAGYITGDNPARLKGHIENLLPKHSKVQVVVNQPALSWNRVPEFIKELPDSGAAKALKLAIICAMRSGEARLLKWNEVDLDANIITIPGERMKAGKEHRIPLSAEGVALLKSLPRTSELVFPGTKPGEPYSDATLLSVIKRMNREKKYMDEQSGKPIVVHGFRASFKTWASESTAYPRELVEAALAHMMESKVEAAYQRTDLLEKRRRLMEAWATFVTTESLPASVTPIRGAE